MSRRGYDFPFEAARAVRLLILDVDGVMTDGAIVMDGQGGEFKAFHVRDGHGIKLLQRAGIDIAIITGRSSAVVAQRAADLGIQHVMQGCLDKRKALDALLASTSLDAGACAMMGDDVLDLPPMRVCGLALAPADAHAAVLAEADWIADHAGGRGAIRQAAEGLILAQGAWEAVIGARYGVPPEACGWRR
ncbi:MAG: HAD-IIIA family hydrolase [Mariprofundaceae bacterium]